jgi:hypothetical protein
MKQHAALLAIVVSFTFTAIQTAASPSAPTAAGPRENSEPATQTKLLKATPAPPSATSSQSRGKAFEVNDVKGLLLKCNAPELDTNPDTDLFDSCALAPGRTLDDVMHTFIQAIHFVQNQQAKERAEWYKELEEKSAQKPAQK